MRKFISIFLLLSALSVQAQHTTGNLSQQYLDSLRQVRNSIYSNQTDSTDLPEVTSPLPVMDNKRLRAIFALENADDALVDSILQFFVQHPELAWPKADSKAQIIDPLSIDDRPSTPQQQLATLPDIIVVQPDTLPTPDIQKPQFWTYRGEFFLQFLQNYISSNWYKGGESSYSMLSTATLAVDYDNQQRMKFTNLLELKLGYITSRSDELHRYKTSDDLIRLTSKLQYQATKHWWYTLQLIAATQFTRGYKSNDPMVYSDFLSPLTLNLSIGMDYQVNTWKKRLQGTVHLAPISLNYKFVERRALAERYGIDAGRHSLLDIGPQTTITLTWKPSDNIQLQTRFYAYTTFHRAELEWENTLTLRFNRYISANIFVYPRFDDHVQRTDNHSYFQLREFTSVGFNYSF